MKKLLESKYVKALEIIEETGKMAMATIDDGDLEKLQDELEKLGYVSYVDESSDWLIVEDVRQDIEYVRNDEKSKKYEDIKMEVIYILTVSTNEASADWYFTTEEKAIDFIKDNFGFDNPRKITNQHYEGIHHVYVISNQVIDQKKIGGF